MNDNFEKELRILKDREKELSKILIERKNMSKSNESTIKVEQKIYNDLESLKRDIAITLRNYTEIYKTHANQIEGNNRINLLRIVEKDCKLNQKTYDDMIDSKYKYVSSLTNY